MLDQIDHSSLHHDMISEVVMCQPVTKHILGHAICLVSSVCAKHHANVFWAYLRNFGTITSLVPGYVCWLFDSQLLLLHKVQTLFSTVSLKQKCNNYYILDGGWGWRRRRRKRTWYSQQLSRAHQKFTSEIDYKCAQWTVGKKSTVRSLENLISVEGCFYLFSFAMLDKLLLLPMYSHKTCPCKTKIMHIGMIWITPSFLQFRVWQILAVKCSVILYYFYKSFHGSCVLLH